MDLEDKRREKAGDFSKQDTLDAVSKELDEVEEFVIAVKYKDGTAGIYTTTSDGVTVLGILEFAKIGF